MRGGRGGQRPITSRAAQGICTWCNQSPLNKQLAQLLPPPPLPALPSNSRKEVPGERPCRLPAPGSSERGPRFTPVREVKTILRVPGAQAKRPQGPSGLCKPSSLTDRNSHIPEILIRGGPGHQPVSLTPQLRACPGRKVCTAGARRWFSRQTGSREPGAWHARLA